MFEFLIFKPVSDFELAETDSISTVITCTTKDLPEVIAPVFSVGIKCSRVKEFLSLMQAKLGDP